MRRRQAIAFTAALPLSARAGIVDWFNGVKVGARLPAYDTVYLNAEPPAEPRLLLIDFWATWCAPCVAAIPRLNDLHQRFAPRGVSLIGLSPETPEVVKPFLARRSMLYPIGAGGKQPLAAALGIKAMPYALIAKPDGTVLWRGQPEGPMDALIEQHLG
jgi:thiol-disulfide isomerase/thioredoxin